MPVLLVIVLSLHLLSSVFWAGSTFALARLGGQGAQALFRPQMGAALVAILAGGYLWGQLHAGPEGMPEHVLGIGAICAILAAGVQGMLVGGTARKLRKGAMTPDEAQRRFAMAHRIAALLLAITLVCMGAQRYV
ncbi:MAG TPA: hypothetical protein VKP60_02975 [Magnetospirillaceae bacterium]|nr:hypothetical protein [Magnetospirillaceae bacterium]